MNCNLERTVNDHKVQHLNETFDFILFHEEKKEGRWRTQTYKPSFGLLVAESYEISFPQKARYLKHAVIFFYFSKAVTLLQPPFNNPDINLPSLEFILYHTHNTKVVVFQEHSVRNNARRADPPPKKKTKQKKTTMCAVF